ncbi:ATP-binding cassette domain-containing protein [Nonomuraea sp. NPDC050556]|uniref:ATP-binding cassette domain-containing protein n=1 Tax=Nonomuraea sp. NPDC050556 TaxID=3364369 RepID=UPI00378A2C89
MLALAALAKAAAELILPLLLGAALDSAIAKDADPRWFAGCALLVVMAIVGEVVTEGSAGVSRADAAARLRRRLTRQLLGAGPAALQRSGTEVLTRDADELARAGPATVREAATLATALGGVAFLFTMDRRLGLTFAVGALLTLVILGQGRQEIAHDPVTPLLEEAVAGLPTIVAAGTQEQEAARILRVLPEHSSFAGREAAAALLGPLPVLAVLAVAGVLLSAHELTTGGLVAAGRYAFLGGGLGAAVTLLTTLAAARRARARIAPLLNTPPLMYGTRDLPSVSVIAPGRLEFHAVTCETLRALTLTVPSGLSVAVVGEGAQTLGALSVRLAEPLAGRVTLDGVELRALSRTALRQAVGYAFAQPVLLGRTVHDMIAFGPGPVDRRSVSAAARAARADTFIRSLPEGYETPAALAPLSSGQAQRLGLARAFAHPGRLLVFDDATASLDTVTEMQVSRAITEELAGRTRLIVASRAATAARADLVAWIDGGRVRALGQHASLWRDPDYRAVFGVSSRPPPHRFSVRKPYRRGGP